ncbi:hypothetical protein EXIGLDRAFT_834133 [Exidia glandulosa HHB12029]|uniref:Uncharacterized protein n=1 Tax=Exidia glandulosa HHB12029 TaxID=1314781 RepID=A0A165K444_EXIGL|nr:hypothetical protein EXIGLDRAFT_834133 [Exidia glandulosa HHB12029]
MDSDMELQRFAELRIPQQLIMIEANCLFVKQLLEAQAEVTTFTISSELEENITKYTCAFLYSAHTRVYKENAQQVVLAAMRRASVVIPAKTDVGRVGIVVARIGARLTDLRSTMKRKLKASVQEDTRTDLATLASDTVAGSGIQLTVEFYHRLAWLRRYGPDIGFDEHDFWGKIDAALAKVRKDFKGEEYAQHFRSTYRKDIKKFGDVATDVPIVLEAALPDFQKLMDESASVATAPTAVKRKPRQKARPARVVVSDSPPKAGPSAQAATNEDAAAS